jgi:hypothetical protein
VRRAVAAGLIVENHGFPRVLMKEMLNVR